MYSARSEDDVQNQDTTTFGILPEPKSQLDAIIADDAGSAQSLSAARQPIRYNDEQINREQPNPMTLYRIIVIAAALLAAAYIVVNTADGVQLSPDSWRYIDAAAIRQVYGALPDNFVEWPPLYPLTLSLFPDLFAGARLLNVISYALTIALAFHTLRSYVTPLGVIGVGGALIASFALRQVHQWAWSEPLFILLTALFFMRLAETRTRQQIILLALGTALACLQRYVGILLIPVGVVALILNRARRADLMVFVLIAALPIGLWMLRNMGLGVGLTGTRGESPRALVESVRLIGVTLIGWLPTLAPAAVLSWWGTRRLPRPLIVGSGLFTLLLIAFVLWGAVTTDMDPPNNRLLSPAYLPVTFLVIAAVRALRERVVPVRAPAGDVSAPPPTGSP
jgi:hypothetical protein